MIFLRISVERDLGFRMVLRARSEPERGFDLSAGKLARGAWGWAAAPEVDCELFARIADLMSRVTRRCNSLWSNACGRLLASQWWVFFSCELFGSFSRLRYTDSGAQSPQ